MYLLLALLFSLAAWRWSDWRNANKYYPTILFMIALNLFVEYVCYDYPLWHYSLQYTLMPSVVFIVAVICIGVFPATILLFLSNYPASIPKQIGYNLFWSVLFMLLEYGAYRAHMLTYHHGWHFGWTVFFDLTMFPILRLHHKKPLWAWTVSALLTIFYWNIFDIPIKHLQ